MRLKYLSFIFVCALLLSGCSGKKNTANTPSPSNQSTKLVVNELPLKDQPFTVLVPHQSNHVFTFVAQNASKAQNATVDLEYLSGDLLKGARSTLETPISDPYIKAIVLGSCSTGGKCAFDKDLKSGTMKFKLNFAGQNVTHVLKGDFTFITGQNNLPDGKVSFSPSKSNQKDNLILMNSFGLPKSADKELAIYPIVLSAVSDKTISGSLTIKQSGITGAAIYDGSSYQPITYTPTEGGVSVSLNSKPWSMKAEITRDDEKGSKESLNLYLLGPIVLYK